MVADALPPFVARSSAGKLDPAWRNAAIGKYPETHILFSSRINVRMTNDL